MVSRGGMGLLSCLPTEKPYNIMYDMTSRSVGGLSIKSHRFHGTFVEISTSRLYNMTKSSKIFVGQSRATFEGNHVSDCLFKPLFLFYGQKRETFCNI